MAKSINDIKRTNLFIKSSTDDFQDPVFLTFRLDFFPVPENYPRNDGVTSSSLLKETRAKQTNLPKLANANVEYSTEDWLNDYYPPNSFTSSEVTPSVALKKFKERLAEVQSSPWYFQSIQGIGDLWKSMHRVKEGNQKTAITINCVDSIKQPLTDMAENYRYAIYDQERLAYRVPDNLRWFDMVIDLVEIRDIVDYSGQFFERDASGELTSGLKVVQFRCKMCEFDFSGFMGGAWSDHKIATEEKSFEPSFVINVGWVIQEKVQLSDAETFRTLSLFSGVFDSLNNRLTRFIQNATRLPGQIVGSVLNELQTNIETKVIGNAYTGANAFLTNMNTISGNLTGRTPLVGPESISSVGTDVYPEGGKSPQVSYLDKAYQGQGPTSSISNIADVYPPDQPAQQTPNIGDTYPDQNPPQPTSEIGEAYQPEQEVPDEPEGSIYPEIAPNPNVQTIGVTYENETPQEISDIGDVYPEPGGTQEVGSLGDSYPDEPAQSSISNLGDSYPEEPNSQSISGIGDVYPDEPANESISNLGDVYPDEVIEETVSSLGDSYLNGEIQEEVADIGSTYSEQANGQSVEEIGKTYSDERSTLSVEEIGDSYQEENRSTETDSIGTVYVEETKPQEIDKIGDSYLEDSKVLEVDKKRTVYQEVSRPIEEVSKMGDVYPDERQIEVDVNLGTAYEEKSIQEEPVKLGDTYPNEKQQDDKPNLGEAYPQTDNQNVV